MRTDYSDIHLVDFIVQLDVPIVYRGMQRGYLHSVLLFVF